MTRTRRQLAQQAIAAALRMRTSAGYRPWQPAPVFELAQQIGIEVRFVGVPSLEGMYWKRREPVILIGAQRPPGRQAFTCGHELGHHAFRHGTKIDEVLDDLEPDREPEEFVADVFAAFLLMPKTAVVHALACGGINLQRATPKELFIVAGRLGVGYRTLIRQLEIGLHLLPPCRAAELLRVQPKMIRSELLGFTGDGGLLVVDENWESSRSIDVQVGDYVLAPADTVLVNKSIATSQRAEQGVLLRADRPGVSTLERPSIDWAAFLRVARKHFEGRSIFRHLEDVDD